MKKKLPAFLLACTFISATFSTAESLPEDYFEKKEAAARAEVMRSPQSEKSRISLVRALIDVGKYDEATREAQRVLAANPNSADAKSALATIDSILSQIRRDTR